MALRVETWRTFWDVHWRMYIHQGKDLDGGDVCSDMSHQQDFLKRWQEGAQSGPKTRPAYSFDKYAELSHGLS